MACQLMTADGYNKRIRLLFIHTYHVDVFLPVQTKHSRAECRSYSVGSVRVRTERKRLNVNYLYLKIY